MFCELTESGGVYDLPIVRIVTSTNTIFERNGRTYALRGLSPTERNSFGWYDFYEEPVDTANYTRGGPVDSITGTLVKREYPNKTPKNDTVLRARKMEAINTTVEVKLSEPILHDGMQVPVDPGTADQLFYTDNAVGATRYFKAANGYFGLTVAQKDALIGAIAARQQAILQAAKAHQDAIQFLIGQGIIDYDISVGWP